MAITDEVLVAVAPKIVPTVFEDGLPPPTHTQVSHWRELCGTLCLAKGHSMANDAWHKD